MTSKDQQVRCPCCGKTFALADALPPEPETPAKASTSTPARTATKGEEGTPVVVKLIFDGGSIGNPGRGYGSYQLTIRRKPEPVQRLEFPGKSTNNEAEYATLIAALEALRQRFPRPADIHLEIRGDSQLVINQITGTWKAKDERMREYKERALALLADFGNWKATWHARGNSVKTLGH